jgi:hypothetical protein
VQSVADDVHCSRTAAGVLQNLFVMFLRFTLAFFVYAAAAKEAAYSYFVQPLAPVTWICYWPSLTVGIAGIIRSAGSAVRQRESVIKHCDGPIQTTVALTHP